jgi:hypothetical protein
MKDMYKTTTLRIALQLHHKAMKRYTTTFWVLMAHQYEKKVLCSSYIIMHLCKPEVFRPSQGFNILIGKYLK